VSAAAGRVVRGGPAVARVSAALAAAAREGRAEASRGLWNGEGNRTDESSRVARSAVLCAGCRFGFALSRGLVEPGLESFPSENSDRPLDGHDLP
jgi:hypothetical protein